MNESGDVEPLLAHYDFRSHILLEKLAEKGVFMPAQIVKNPKVNKISPPDHLTAAWTNINTKIRLKYHRKQTKIHHSAN